MARGPSFTKSDFMRAIRGDSQAQEPQQSGSADAWITELWEDDKRLSSYGHIPTIAARLGCSEQTVRNYAKRKIKGELTKQAVTIQAAIETERQLGFVVRAEFDAGLISDARIGLRANVKLLDVQSIKFALERLDKEHFAARSEMTGADGQNLFDDEARRALAELGQMLDDMGRDPSEAMIDAVNSLKAKLAAIKNRGKPDADDNTFSTERGDD